jgi:hypothetical protein
MVKRLRLENSLVVVVDVQGFFLSTHPAAERSRIETGTAFAEL